jgi:hypothetical protein
MMMLCLTKRQVYNISGPAVWAGQLQSVQIFSKKIRNIATLAHVTETERLLNIGGVRQFLLPIVFYIDNERA